MGSEISDFFLFKSALPVFSISMFVRTRKNRKAKKIKEQNGFCFSVFFFFLYGNVCWMGQSFLTVVLALNRCLSMSFPSLGDFLFIGKRTFLWIGAALGYMILLFLTTKSGRARAHSNASVPFIFFQVLFLTVRYTVENFFALFFKFFLPLICVFLRWFQKCNFWSIFISLTLLKFQSTVLFAVLTPLQFESGFRNYDRRMQNKILRMW